MGKGALGLVTGFWPEGVYRYIAPPGIYLDEALVTRPAKRRPDAPALVIDSQSLSYSQLTSQVDEAMKGLLTHAEGEKARVALALSSSEELLKLFLGAVKGRCAVFLANPSASPQVLMRQIGEFKAEVVVGDSSALENLAPLRDRVKLFPPQGIWEGEKRPGEPGKARLTSPSIALPGRGGRLAYHSHTSILAGALSWSTFLAMKEDEAYLSLRPLHTWGGLFCLLGNLFRAAPSFFASWEDPEKLSFTVGKGPKRYTLLALRQAMEFTENPLKYGLEAWRKNLGEVYVMVPGSFQASLRKRLKGLLGRPVLTLFGSAEAGPILSSHPEWYLDESVGIPVTNVDVWPLNPGTGNPLQVPWESVEYGEIGAKSPMNMISYPSREETEGWVKEGWVRTQRIANMDANGLFYMLEE